MHDIDDYPGATAVQGLVVYRYDSPLFFANVEDFKRRALASLDRTDVTPEWFLLNAEANVQVDITAIDALEELRTELDRRGIVFAMARVKQDLRADLRPTAFLDRVEGRVAAIEPEAETYLFGHLGDGNVHVNVLGAARSEEEVEDAVLGLVLECGGTISAEHGIGTAKAAWVERALGQDNVHVMRAIKDSLDPDSIMNPGAVLPLDLPD